MIDLTEGWLRVTSNGNVDQGINSALPCQQASGIFCRGDDLNRWRPVHQSSVMQLCKFDFVYPPELPPLQSPEG